MLKSATIIGIALGFVRVGWGVGLRGHGHDAKFDSARKWLGLVSIA